MFKGFLSNIKVNKPVVECITNFVTINDCANIALAVGASPTMASAIEEVEDFVTISSALVINMGNLSSTVIPSMIKAGKKANELNIPVILDPVGIGTSSFRKNALIELLSNIHFTTIRGNLSEIKILCGIDTTAKGVDVSDNDKIQKDNLSDALSIAKLAATKTDAIIAVTGEIDIITDGATSYYCYNGVKSMSQVTGCGCMCTTLIGAFCSSNNDKLSATALAVAAMGFVGELAFTRCTKENRGTGSLRTYIIDEISLLTEESLLGGIKLEIK